MEKIYLPNPAPLIFPNRTRFTHLYPAAAETIGRDLPVSYLEFGVFKGNSIIKMASIFTNPGARFIGFDSFEGLPEAWRQKRAGFFSVEGQVPQTDDQRISFVKGYFQNTLPGFLENLRRNPAANAGPVLIHFDADLYSATLFLLGMLWQHIPEYYFIFDEFFSDEAVALHDFMLAYPVEIEYLAGVESNVGPRQPMQLFGRMKRIAFTLPAAESHAHEDDPAAVSVQPEA